MNGIGTTCSQCVSYNLKIEQWKVQTCAKGFKIMGTDQANDFCGAEFIFRNGGMLMDEIRSKCNTHVVLKIEDLKNVLNEKELQSLVEIQHRIWRWRKHHHKTNEGYLVVNRDEPYAELLQQWILWFERMAVVIYEKIKNPIIKMNTDEIEERCEHGKLPGDCGKCECGNHPADFDEFIDTITDGDDDDDKTPPETN